MKRIITIQDISCVGRCSLTVALPIISAAGVEACILPTAVLSTHPAFPEFTFRDLTDEIQPISDTLARLGIDFDAIYTGYLGSPEQLALVADLIDRFRKPGAEIFIDPVLGDNGSLYKGFTQDFADRMTRLCAKADLILPNMTEAAFMLHEDYREEYDEDYVRGLLVRLTSLGARRAALTGIGFRDDEIGFYMYDAESGEFSCYFNEKLPMRCHGTGDIFASAALGGRMRGLGYTDSLALATDYTLECIRKTIADPSHRSYGVNFEQALPYYISEIEKRTSY